MIRAVVVGPLESALDAALDAALISVRSEAEESLQSSYGPDNVGEVVVVDCRGRRDVPDWLSSFRQHHPSAPILALVPSLDAALILQAVRAGANEVLPEPFDAADVEAAFARLSVSRGMEAAGRVLAFVGAKGGVGTTMTAVNVATTLSRRAPTLLVDLHLANGDAAVLLGVEPRFSVVDALENTQRLDKAFLKGLVSKPKTGPDILPSSERPFAPIGAGQNIRPLLDFLSKAYPYSILDVPRSDATTLDALDAVSKVVLIANQELSAVRNAARMAETLRQRYGAERLALVVSRYDPQSDIGQDDIERLTGIKGAIVVPSDYRLAVQSLNTGRPLVLDNNNRLAASYRALAERLVGGQNAKQEPAPSGLLGRLLRKRS